MERAYYATHNAGSLMVEGQVFVLDNTRPEDQQLLNTGYLKEIKDPERGEPQGAHRAG